MLPRVLKRRSIIDVTTTNLEYDTQNMESLGVPASRRGSHVSLQHKAGMVRRARGTFPPPESSSSGETVTPVPCFQQCM